MADERISPEAIAKAVKEIRQVREAEERHAITAEHIAWQDLLTCKIKEFTDYDVNVKVEENAFSLSISDRWYEHRFALKRVPCTAEQRIKILTVLYAPVPQGGWRVYDLFSAISAVFREK